MQTTMRRQLDQVKAEQAATSLTFAPGAWLWLDAHTERALARGELPDAVITWCRELRQQRTQLLRTARRRKTR